MDMCWKNPFSVFQAWPNIPVKIYFIKNLSENTNHCLSKMPEKKVWSGLCTELFSKHPFIKYVQFSLESQGKSFISL